MNKVRASKAVPVILLFGMLAASAATGYPAVDDDGYTPRGARALIFVVETFGTDHFGATGGAAFFAVLGVLLAGLAVMEPRRESDKSFARPLSATAKPPRRDNEAPVRRPPPNAPRLRTISARTFISSAPDAGRPSPPPAPTAAEGARPAWGLMLASPWSTESDHNSWLGGLPCAPPGFEWPRETEDGEPMHFYAQIDLADLAREPSTGRRAAGLPEAGAMLVFIGHGCGVRIIPAHDMADAQPMEPPSDLPSLRKFGFWIDGNVFPAWPIVPRVFLDRACDDEDHEEEPPAAFPNPHRTPADWITNWGMAALEADTTITTLGHEIRNAQWSLDYQLKQQAGAGGDAAADDESLRQEAMGRIGHYPRLLLTEGPTLVSELEAWLTRAEAMDPEEPVDAGALEQIFARRTEFCAKAAGNYGGTIALRGAPYRIWERMAPSVSGRSMFVAVRELPAAYRRFAEERITSWRRHRLFGFEPPFPNNWENLDGKAPLISIGADPLLRTQTEHEYGISLWGTIGDLEAVRYDRLEVVRHCAV